MYSFYIRSPRGTVLAIAILLLIQSNTASCYLSSQPLHTDVELEAIQKRATPTDQEQNALGLYGIGVRVGSYLQGFAFILGFATIEHLDPRTQFAGIILAFQLLFRWWILLPAHALSIPQLWVGLAQLLLFTTPGAFLLFLSFSSTRRHWKTRDGKKMPRKVVIRGEGLNFLQVFIILAWINVTNFRFAATVSFDLASEAVLPDTSIWMWKLWPARSTWFITFMWIQSIVTVFCEGVPYLFYLVALYGYVRDYVRNSSAQYDPIERGDGNPTNWMHRLLKWLWTGIKTLGLVILALGAIFYVGMLMASIEYTIIDANLGPNGNLQDPDQMLPFVTGIVAFLSASANLLHNLHSKTPVRVEQSPKGDPLIFTKDGEGLPREYIELTHVRVNLSA